MNKSDMLELIGEKVCNCTKCPELTASRTQTVLGEGNPDADLVFVGEGPGKREDATGRPFVGDAGKLLDNILKACGLERESVYICNAIKCRPEYNRTPWPQEVQNCRSFLNLQMRVISPKVIVCLGNSAAQSVLETKDGVNKLRGSWYSHGTAKVRVTFHPAYLLRSPDKKADVWEDMQEVLRVLNGH
jgi:DNA polymerase